MLLNKTRSKSVLTVFHKSKLLYNSTDIFHMLFLLIYTPQPSCLHSSAVTAAPWLIVENFHGEMW